MGGISRDQILPTQVLSQLSTGAQHRKPRAKEGQGNWKYVQGGSQQSLEASLCQKGVAHRALQHLANKGQGESLPLPL